jgi:hypothetical protein
MSSLNKSDVMFAVEDDGTLVISRGYGFRVQQFGDQLAAGDLVHMEGGPNFHQVWRLTGERDSRGAYRGVWPD